MQQSKLSLDKFLEDENAISHQLLFIIETYEDDKKNISISPWNKNGCNCSGKISIAKNLVESVEKTDHSHYCCGKTHSVVQINFVKDASIKIEDLLRQIAMNVNHTVDLTHHRNLQFDMNNLNHGIREKNPDFFLPFQSIPPGFETCRPESDKMVYDCPNGGYRIYRNFIDIRTRKPCAPTVVVADFCRRFDSTKQPYSDYPYGNGIA